MYARQRQGNLRKSSCKRYTHTRQARCILAFYHNYEQLRNPPASSVVTFVHGGNQLKGWSAGLAEELVVLGWPGMYVT